MTSTRILVTPRSLTKGDNPALGPLSAAGYELVFCTPGVQPSEEELLRLLSGCVGYLAGVETISARALEAAAGLKVISRNGTGVDNVDRLAAARLGIRVLPAAGANARGVAELTIGLILALARSIPFSDAGLKAAKWSRREGVELEGRTLGLVGCGHVGRLVAPMARGLGMAVLGCDPAAAAVPCDGFRYVGLPELLAGSDVISLHCPAPSDGRPLIAGETIARMKRGAYLVNTARASLLDVLAVLAALESGQLSGVATDVFEHEPPGDDPLARHPRVIATPHIGGYTAESVARAATAAVENLLKALGPASATGGQT